jgi:hypothetical protein
MNKHRKITIVAATGLAILMVTVGVYLAVWHQPGKRAAEPLSSRVWIITRHALDQVSKDPSAREAISRDTIYSPSFVPSKAIVPERGLHLIPTKTYQSEAAFESDVAAHKIPAYVKAILYDNEPWALTPDAEKQDPLVYYERAYALAHAHGYSFIATPVPRSLAPSLAPYADVVDVQAQSEQSSSATYVAAVEDTVHQIALANPKAVIVSGLSTNPGAGDPTPTQLLDIARATYPKLVRGWWLYVTGQGTARPKCHQPRPDIGIQFLKLLGPAL